MQNQPQHHYGQQAGFGAAPQYSGGAQPYHATPTQQPYNGGGYAPPQPPPQPQYPMGAYPPQQHQPQQFSHPPQAQYPPPSLHHQQQQQPTFSTITFKYLGPSCCACMDCCGCCGLQPGRRGALTITVDGKEYTSVPQGSQSDVIVTPGNHKVEVSETGVISGFLSSIGLGKRAGTGVMVSPGQTLVMEMGWKLAGTSRYDPYVIAAR